MILNRRTLILASALTVLCSGAPPIWAATLTWNNTGGGNWNVAGNWTPNGIPGAADTAMITASGTYVVSVSDAESAASVTINPTPGGAALQISSGGVLSASGASVSATSSLTVKSGGSLNLAGQSSLYGPLTNAGTMNLTNATIYTYNNNTANYTGGIANQGQINLYGSSGVRINAELGDEYFINLGTVNEQVGAGTSLVSAGVGLLQGAYNTASGTTLQFSGGSVSVPLTPQSPLELTGPGIFQFTSGYLLLPEDIIPNLTLMAGTLELGPAFQQGGAITNLALDGITLAGTCQVNGKLTATNSTLNGAITVNNGGSITGFETTIAAPVTVNSGGAINVSQSTLAVTGPVTLKAGGVLNITRQFTIYSPVTNAGTMNLSNATIYIDNNQGASYEGGIVNQGQLNFSGSSGNQINSELGDEYFLNQGTVNQQAGAGTGLISADIGLLQGTYNAASGTTLQFNGGRVAAPLTPQLTFALNGPGLFQFTGGYLLLTSDIVPNLTMTGGALQLGPAFQQGGAITNLALDGIALAGACQVDGTFTATNSTLNGSITVNNGGLVTGYESTITAPITVNSGGAANVSQSTLGVSGSLIIEAGGVLNITRQFTLYGAVTNAGTMNLSNATVYIDNNQGASYEGGIVNQGQLNLFGSSGNQINSELGDEYFFNQGTVNQQAGAGTGLINASTGLLQGAYNAASGTTLQLSGGSASAPLTPQSPLTLNGPGIFDFTAGYLLLTSDIVPNLTMTGGILQLGPAFQQGGAITNLALDGITLAGSCQVDGAFTATNSAINGAITVNKGGSITGFEATIAAPMTVNSGGAVNVSQSTLGSAGSLTLQAGGVLNITRQFTMYSPLTNAGTMNLSNATIYIYNNQGASYEGGIVNQGQLNLSGSSGNQINSELGDEYFINQGVISQRPGTGSSLISAPIFPDAGAVDSQHGILTLSGLNLQSSSVLNFGLNSPTDFGVIAVPVNTVLAGTVSANFNNGFVPATGASFKVLTGPVFSGVFGNISVPSGATAQGVYGATAFSLLFGSSGTSGASPVLTIGRIGGSTVNISWPTAAGNFTLQSSPDLTPGSWSSIVSGITTVGPNYVLTIGVGGEAAFYRLESQ